jgi:hypothetical protein
MRKTVAICILLSFLIQTLSRVFIIADYYANTASYAKYCINKALPKLHCNGKCQMMKKLLLEEKKDQENTERRENLKNLVLSSKTFFAEIDSPCILYFSLIVGKHASNYDIIDRCFDIFHPPQS